MTLMKQTIYGSAVRILLPLIVTVPFANAQCENKTGFAKQACQVAAGSVTPANSKTNPPLARLKGEPLSTTFADTIHLDTLPPSVEPKAFKQLARLERTDDGAFLLKTGIYEAYVQCYSLDPGERWPPRIGGFYPAPIKGRRAKVIGDVLKQVELHPEVAQTDVQQLLWGIVSGADLEKMTPQVQQAAAKILPRDMLALIQGSVVANAVEKSLMGIINRRLSKDPQAKPEGAVPNGDTAAIDQQLTLSDTGADAKDAPAAPSPDAVAMGPVLRGTWAQMPGGFYVRYLPEGYTRIRVQVIVSDAAMAQADPKDPLAFDPTQYLAVYSQGPSQRLGITLRLVAGKP